MKQLFGFFTLFGIILFVASCGDDVTVVGPPGRDTVQVPVLIRVDTVKVRDTIFVPRIDTVVVNKIVTKIDTVVVNKIVTKVDTVVVTKVVTKVDTLIKTVTKYDTVFVNIGKVDTVVVRIRDTVFVPTPIVCDYSIPAGHRPKECPPRTGKP